MAGSGDIDGKGWLLIGAASLGVAVCVIPVAILPMGVFIKPLGKVFGWGRGEFGLALTILSLGMALALPVAGRLIDRYGVRYPVMISQILFGGGMLLLPTLIEAYGLYALYGVALWLGVTGSASSSIAFVRILSGWFDRSRGLALGFAMSGVALGGAVTNVLAASLIAAYDWRVAFYGLAMLPLVIGIPVGLYMRDAPSAVAQRAGGVTQQLAGFTAAQVSRQPTFWILLALFLIAATAIHGIQIHLVALLSDRGLSPDNAALGVAFLFGVSLIVRLAGGYAFDYIFAPWVGAVCFLAAAIGAAMMIPPSEPWFYLIAVALLGVGAGAETDLLAILVSRYFGLRAFGAIYGWLFAAFMTGSAVGPFILGMGFDATGDYATALMWCAGGLALTTVLLLALPRFPTWAAGEPAEADVPAIAAAQGA